MEENPLDLEQHEEETLWDVWKRRLMFFLLIALCVTFAAPSFSSCDSAIGSGGSQLYAKYRVGGETVDVARADFDAVWSRLALTLRVVDQAPPQSDDQVWSHILLNAAAEREGLYVPQERVDRWLAAQARFQQGGAFDEGAYRAALRDSTDARLSHKGFSQTLTELLRIREYLGVYQTAFELVPSEEAFARWQARNEKLSVSYVVQPFAGFRAAVEAENPSDEDLAKFARLPTAADRLRVGARKTVEAAVLLVRDMDDVQVVELENLLRDQGVLTESVDVPGLKEYYGARDAIYTRENWLRDAREKYALAMEHHAGLVQEWEKQDEATRGERPPEPPDPALDAVPDQIIDRYKKFWKPRVVREVLAREFLRLFAARAERENRTFEDLAKEYLVTGVRVVKNETPLEDSEFAEGYPLDLGRDSELATTVRTYLRGPATGRTFTPEVHLEPVPTTRLGRTLNDRGYMVLRLDAFESSRLRDVSEARDEIVEMWRDHEVRTRSKDRLDAIRTKVLDGLSTLETAAAADGLDVSVLRRFNRATAERRPAAIAPGAEPDAARLAAIAAVDHRNRVVRDYPILLNVEPGQFRASVLLDDRTGAAYLVRVDSKHSPGPMEIGAPELQAERFALMDENRDEIFKLQSLESLKKRFQLEIRADDPPTKETGDESGDGDTNPE